MLAPFQTSKILPYDERIKKNYTNPSTMIICIYVKDNKGLLFSLVTLKISLSYCTLKQVLFPKLTGNV